MKNIHEISTNDFRQKFKSLGHSESRSELTSGGEISSEFLDVLSKFIEEWTQIGGSSCKIMFTSGNDNFHKNLGSKSRHSVGQAVDLTLPNSCHTKFIELLNTYKSKYDGFSYIDEYRNPSKHATGPHFHLSYSKGKPEIVGTTSTSTGTETTQDPTSKEVQWSDILKPIGNQLKKFGFNEETNRFQRLANVITESITFSSFYKPVEYSKVTSLSKQIVELKVVPNKTVVSPDNAVVISRTDNKVVLNIKQRYTNFELTIKNLTNIKVGEGDSIKKGGTIGKTEGGKLRLEIDKGDFREWFKIEKKAEPTKSEKGLEIKNLYNKQPDLEVKNLYNKETDLEIKNLYNKGTDLEVKNLYSKNINEDIEKIKRLLK